MIPKEGLSGTHVKPHTDNVLALLTACNYLQAPRFIHPTEEGPIIPLSVKLVFDEFVRSASVEQAICADVLWTGLLGDVIVQSFSETGRARLTQLTVGAPSETAQPATIPTSEFTAPITLASPPSHLRHAVGQTTPTTSLSSMSASPQSSKIPKDADSRKHR